ncbi:N-acetyldiaminopimelate deacetylase [Lactiplantibacillus sp. WILCCON 0030]|uniref:N-acetyldiaminopimelate deacetylase n=1 Tax=Lactiplantibacillus brownii TaxID=3069269 RepID=A0ABU1ABE1_9LACO|nr:N-acetyldiaminopimelate deacetylase [Lactiplantibacillus brownii]MDQ7937698.1 N-acetyldiaminopimelate deacetylase [Lactiplantibacillus brownii]
MALQEADLIPIYQHLHQIPELGLEEHETHAYLLSIIAKMPQDLLTIKTIPTLETAILVKVSGKRHDYRIGYRTDIDGLPVTEATGLPFASQHPGKMHACGHDIHMSVALGILSYFAENQPETDMIFMFQPAEENASGGKRLYESGALDAEWLPDEIFAFHDNPDLPAGAIGCRMGTLFAGTCEIHAHLTGKSGHAAFPHNANDMVVAGSALVQQLQTIVSRNVDPIQSGVVTLGHFTAGTIGNVIAGEAQIDGTIRALTQEMNLHIQRRVRTIVEGIALAYDCNIDLDLHQGGYYPVENNDKITADFMAYMKQAADVNFIETRPAMTGEDFGFLIHQIPGTMFWLGVDSPYSLHSEHMVPHTSAIMAGVNAMTGYLTHRNELQK